jgi:hypothetical protein
MDKMEKESKGCHGEHGSAPLPDNLQEKEAQLHYDFQVALYRENLIRVRTETSPYVQLEFS